MIRRLAWPLIAIALLVAAATTAPTTRSHTSKPDRAALPPLPELPHASMLVDSARSEIVLELPPTAIPAAGMARLPVFQAVMSVSGSISHFPMELGDPSRTRGAAHPGAGGVGTCLPTAPGVMGRAAPPSPGRSWEWAATCTTTA